MNSNDLLLEVLFKYVLSSIHSTPSSKDESWTINPTNEWLTLPTSDPYDLAEGVS